MYTIYSYTNQIHVQMRTHKHTVVRYCTYNHLPLAAAWYGVQSVFSYSTSYTAKQTKT